MGKPLQSSLNTPVIIGTELITGEATEARKQIFLAHYRRHGIRVQAALAAQVSIDTVRRWLNQDAEFRADYEVARLMEAGRMQNVIRTKALKGNVTAARYLNDALNPEEFSARGVTSESAQFQSLPADVPDAVTLDELPFIDVEGTVVE